MPRRSRKSKKRASQPIQEEEDGWYTVRGILDERKLKGKAEYLVDWDDNPVTGESYPSSWVPTEWVTKDSIKEWEAEKRRKAQEPPPSSTPRPDDSDEDIRPSHWRRSLKRTHESPVSRPRSSSSTHDEPPRKRGRLETQERTSEEPTSSIISAETRDFESLPPPASLHLEGFSRLGGQRLAIELNKPSEFNPSDYQSITNTQRSSQLVSELEEEDHRTILASELSQRTIPDSQDLSCSTLPQSLSIVSEEPADISNPTESVSGRPPSSLCVILDSQEHIINRPVSTSAEQTVKPVSINESTSNWLRRDNILNSEAPPLDIPSHQPEHPQVRSSGSPDLSTDVPEPPPTDHSVPKTSTPGIPEHSASSSASRKSLFLTQPHNPLGSPAVTSSLPDSLETRLFQGFSSLRTNNSSTNHHTQRQNQERNTPQPSPGESQAAQVVSRDFDPFTDKITDSNSTERNLGSLSETISQAEHHKTPSPQLINQPSQVFPGQDCSTENHTEPGPDTLKQQLARSRHVSPEQEPSTGNRIEPSPQIVIVNQLLAPSRPKAAVANMEESSSSGRPLTDEMLKTIFNFGGEMLPPDFDFSGDTQPQDIAEPLPGESAIAESNSEPTPEVAARSLEAGGVLSQPHQMEPWKPEVLGNTGQDMPPPSISPASVMPNPNISAADAMKNIVDLTFGASSLLSDTSVAPQGTISPADLSCSVGPGEASHTLMLPLSDQAVMTSGFDESPGQSIPMGQGTQHNYTESSASSQDTGPLEHAITLPFQASRRPYYDNTLCEYRAEAEAYGDIFNSEVYKEPDEGLEQRIDELFARLFNICDYPQDLVGTRLEDLPLVQQAKYSSDASPKFNFMHELLGAIERDTDVLVLARTPELLRLLYAETEALELESVCHGFEKPDGTVRNSAARVTLALSSEDFDPFKFQAVIGFDHTFSHSPVSRRLASGSAKERAPLVLQLVTTHSIEHILLHIPQDISAMEKKNALLSGIVQARGLIEDPEPGYSEPHQAARTFSAYLNGLTESISWEPQSIPDNVLDFFLNTQSLTQALEESKLIRGNGHKRKLDAEEDSDDAKRMRVLPVIEPVLDSHDPPLTYPMRALLDSARPKGQAKERMSKISIPLAVLEVLAEQVAEYKRQAAANELETQYKAIINRLEKQVKEYQRTTNRVEKVHREALQDRSSFEKATLKAEEAMKTAAEAAQKESDKQQKRIAELEGVVARLTATSGDEESPLSRTERLLEESQKKVKTLEKRLENAQNETDYIRDVYQDVNSKSGTMAAEIKTLRKQNEDLEQKASENLKQIHQIQADAAKEAHLNHIAELKTLVREQEYELGRLCEERTFRNGRPSTRQASVPRSPRTGMMSPRPGRGFGGSASRGTSPALPGHDGNGSGGISGVQFMGQQPGNGRWGHLRD